jgi:hypothetical protein
VSLPWEYKTASGSSDSLSPYSLPLHSDYLIPDFQTLTTMPTTTTTTTPNIHSIITDLPPAYSPPTSPPYFLSDRAADRGNCAFAIMHHNLTYNSPFNSRPPSPSPDALPPSPGDTPTNSNPTPRTSRAQRAALRDFQATQDPALWGRRVGHGRQARLIRDENQGFWAWLGNLLVDEDRGRAVIMSAGSPWGLMGPPGHI